MRVAAGADQRRHLDTVAADVLREVGEDREAGDDLQLLLRLRAGKIAASAAISTKMRTTARRIAHASRWRRGKQLPQQPADGAEQQRDQ